MKESLRIILFFLVCPVSLFSQITTPVIRANFGVDADLRSNYFNGLVQSGNDDWFMLPGSVGTGQFIIDTTGAAAIVARYAIDPAFRKLPLYRGMRYPQFSVINNRLLIDADFIRDYHGDDSTIFASGASKNGMSPADWSCPVSQNIPDKNDILDLMVHVRRAGPNLTDSLWMFGGISVENVTGDRYFDFEMFQTDIYYDRTVRKFFNYGPDAGHTSWKFDAAGNVTQPGDIIFSADYGSATLSSIEARIWIDKASLLITPVNFNWSGQFDGAAAGSQYGYASIQPKTAGAFYAGLECVNNTWAGPFSLIRENNNVVTTYIAIQYMEFSVNLTKLGLDPISLLGGNACGMPFRRIFVKTRASTSFTAELKDFVAPFNFFKAPKAEVDTDIPILCDSGGVSHIYVTNPLSTSTYIWSTTNGHIVGSNIGTSINVDRPGTYIVTQYLNAACSPYASDTIVIGRFENCELLENNLIDFRAVLNNNQARLNWTVLDSRVVSYFDIERSTDAVNFTVLDRIHVQPSEGQVAEYNYTDDVSGLATRNVYYRIRMKDISSRDKYSDIIKIPLTAVIKNKITIAPNPVKDLLQLQISSVADNNVNIHIYDQVGQIVAVLHFSLQKGNNIIVMNDLAGKPYGTYQAIISLGTEIFSRKILLVR